MASVTLNVAPTISSGSVTVYPKSNWPYGTSIAGAPVGASVTSGTVDSSGSVTLSGLTEGTAYVAYQASPDRYISLFVPRPNPNIGPTGPTGPAGAGDPSISNTWLAAQHFKAGPFANPGAFGAVGDGTTDDTAALQAALDSGHSLWLKRGATYLTRRMLTASTAGQVIFGNGAMIKRRAQIVTTTATNIATGTTAIVVADAAGIQVGDHFSLESGGVYTTIRQVQSVVGTTVTFTSAIGTAFASGATVRSAWTALILNGNDSRVQDLQFDGNKANVSWARWDTTAEIGVTGQRVVVERCYVNNAPGEAISVGDAEDCRTLYNTITNANGNGIHYGGTVACNGGRIIGNHVKTVNLDTTVGHADGCVVLSNVIADFLVQGNRLEAGLAGVGSIDTVDNLDVTIIGNEIRSCTKAVEGDMASNSSSVNVLFEGNRVYSSGSFSLTQFNASTTFPARWKIQGNLFVDTAVILTQAEWIDVVGNTIRLNDITSTGINVTNCRRILIHGNHINGGAVGVLVGSATSTDVQISNNVFTVQNTWGIRQGASASASPNFLVTGNSISNDSTASTNYVGIDIGSDAVAHGNNVVLTKGTRCIYAGRGNKGVIKDNYCKGAASGNAIRIETGSTSWVVKDNETDVAVNDAGTTTTISGNVVL